MFFCPCARFCLSRSPSLSPSYSCEVLPGYWIHKSMNITVPYIYWSCPLARPVLSTSPCVTACTHAAFLVSIYWVPPPSLSSVIIRQSRRAGPVSCSYTPFRVWVKPASGHLVTPSLFASFLHLWCFCSLSPCLFLSMFISLDLSPCCHPTFSGISQLLHTTVSLTWKPAGRETTDSTWKYLLTDSDNTQETTVQLYSYSLLYIENKYNT